MHRAPLLRFAALACLLPFAAALAQQSAAPAQPAATRDLPTPEQLEPAVNTTPGAPPAAAPQAQTHAAPHPLDSPGPAPGAKAASGETAAASTAPAASAAPATPAAHKGPDRLQLDATEITGNRELPKVLYIVPWKRSDLGDLVGRPVNSLLDEVLEPLDRDVFQRENRYYNGLKPPAATASGGAPQGPESRP